MLTKPKDSTLHFFLRERRVEGGQIQLIRINISLASGNKAKDRREVVIRKASHILISLDTASSTVTTELLVFCSMR